MPFNDDMSYFFSLVEKKSKKKNYSHFRLFFRLDYSKRLWLKIFLVIHDSNGVLRQLMMHVTLKFV